MTKIEEYLHTNDLTMDLKVYSKGVEVIIYKEEDLYIYRAFGKSIDEAITLGVGKYENTSKNRK